MPPPWPPGCYDGAPAGTLRLVVISELPRTRDTLLLRMMGAGQTFRDAVARDVRPGSVVIVTPESLEAGSAGTSATVIEGDEKSR